MVLTDIQIAEISETIAKEVDKRLVPANETIKLWAWNSDFRQELEMKVTNYIYNWAKA